VVNVGDVSTNGTTVEAFNLAASGNEALTVTVNGVVFTGLLRPSPLTSSSTSDMLAGNTSGNTVDVGGSAGLLGQYAIGTFTADGSNQTLSMDSQGFGNSFLTAYQIRTVPEPGSLTLLFGGLLGLLAYRRRR
jgi:hypothetical protein